MNAKHVSGWNMLRLDAKPFARAQGALEGLEPVLGFARLAAECAPGSQLAEAAQVQWSLRGELRAGPAGEGDQAWLHLIGHTTLTVACQRCLGALQTPLAVDRWFRLVADEATAEALDDASEEDLLALEPRPNLRQVLEDELIMALPLVPKHGVCPQALPMHTHEPAAESDAAVPGAGLAGGARKNPFARLAELKKRGGA